MTSFAGGVAQAACMTRVRDLAPHRRLAVDVGKHAAMALIADHYGQLVEEPFEFALTAWSVRRLLAAMATAAKRVSAASLRLGIEAAGPTTGRRRPRCATKD